MACISAGMSYAHPQQSFRRAPGGFSRMKSSHFDSFSTMDVSGLDRPVESRPPMPVPEETGPCLLDQLVAQVTAQQQTADQRESERHVRLGYEPTVLYCSDGSQPVPVLQSSFTPPKPKPRRMPSKRSLSCRSLSEGEAPVAEFRSEQNLSLDERFGDRSSSDGRSQSSSDLSQGLYQNQTARSPLILEGVPTKWFHAAITRKEAEAKLQKEKPGSFLIRIGERHLGYSLSLKTSTGFKHYIIRQPGEQAFQLGTHAKIHSTIHELVDYFHDHALSANGESLMWSCDY